MKNKLFFLLLALGILSCHEKAGPPLTGHFSLTVGMPRKQTLYLTYMDKITGGERTDNVSPDVSPVVFEGELAEPSLARLSLRPGGSDDDLLFFLEPSAITVTVKDSLRGSIVKGSHSNETFAVMQQKIDGARSPLKSLVSRYEEYKRSNDSANTAALELQIDFVERTVSDIYRRYAEETAPSSPVMLYALTQYAGPDSRPGEVEALLNRLDGSYAALPAARRLAEWITRAKKVDLGQLAPDFTQNDTAGQPVRLSSFKGKYVLLDFWASWCGPCRAENPNVVRMYDRYKTKGFTVIGVSLDQPGSRDKWLTAIHNDRLEWTQVSDLQGWNNAIAGDYGIQSIPQNFLIDPSGRIIARNIRGPRLGKRLAEILH